MNFAHRGKIGIKTSCGRRHVYTSHCYGTRHLASSTHFGSFLFARTASPTVHHGISMLRRSSIHESAFWLIYHFHRAGALSATGADFHGAGILQLCANCVPLRADYPPRCSTKQAVPCLTSEQREKANVDGLFIRASPAFWHLALARQ